MTAVSGHTVTRCHLQSRAESLSERKKQQQHNIDISHKRLFTADNFIVIHASPAITEAVESCEMYSECVACRSLTCQRNAAVFEKDHSPETDLIDTRILAVL